MEYAVTGRQTSKTTTLLSSLRELTPTPPPLKWFKQPLFHLKAPQGWLNDPCAPGYDPTTRTYHLFYQWNPKSCSWGDIAWGQFTSRDGLHWIPQGEDPALRPDQNYDDKGIFTGCFWPTGPQGEVGHLTVVYSSVTHLPIHWTLPYTRNCAGLSLATSTDGGQTWQKFSGNPILRGEPEGLTVTGFRDPYLAPWPGLDMVRRHRQESATADATDRPPPNMLYGILSGGIVGRGPNVFVYAVPADDLTSWTYLGPLIAIPIDLRRPDHWGGDFGINWECVNFMTLHTEDASYSPEFALPKKQQNFLIFSTEGGFKKQDLRYGSGGNDRSKDSTAPPSDAVQADFRDGDARQGSWTMWMAGTLQKTHPGGDDVDGVCLRPDYSGLLDCGTLYAPNSYEHPETHIRICWGWIQEKQLSVSRCEARGWAGYLSLPRELFLLHLSGVVRAWTTPLVSIPSIQIVAEDQPLDSSRNGTDKGSSRVSYSVYTLGIRPLRDLASLRRGSPCVWGPVTVESLDRRMEQEETSGIGTLVTSLSPHWEMRASIRVGTGLQRVGFHILHSLDLAKRVSIYLAPDDEEIVVDTSLSNDAQDIKKDLMSGPFTLFTMCGSEGEQTELLQLHIFSDGDTLEVFANDRFALSMTVYTDADSCNSISCFAEGIDTNTGGNSAFESITLWDAMGSSQK